MAVIVEKNEIWLTGTVGAYWWDDGFTAVDVDFALMQIGRSTDIVVHLNSGGGFASEGSAIHSRLSAHRGNVEIIVEGIAASAASIVAMAAKRLVMSLGATLMIHDPMVDTSGNIAAHQKSINCLEVLASGFADIYAEKSGKNVDEMRSLMAAETWMTAEEAVAAGFADATTAASARAANDNQPTAFAYRAYARAPGPLVALADARGWQFPPAHPAVAMPAKASNPPPPSTREPTMPTIEELTAELAETKAKLATMAAAEKRAATEAAARIQAIMTSDKANANPALARHLAYETEMSVEPALTLLAAAGEDGDATASTDPAAGYAVRRAAAAGLAQPGGGDQKSPRAALADVVSSLKKRR